MKKYSICIVGLGRIFHKHIQSIEILKKHFQLIAVSDLKLENFNNLKKKYNSLKKINFYLDYVKMVKVENPDIVVILTESGNHAKHFIKLSNICKTFVIEKPLCLKFSDVKKIKKIKNKNKNNLFVVKQNRFNEPVKLMNHYLKKNKFGKVFLVSSSIKWMRNEHYYNQASWRGTYSLDGGVIGNQGSHQLDLILNIVGKIDKINSMGIKATNKKIEYHDTVNINMLSKSKILVSLRVTTSAKPHDIEGTLTVLGDKGAMKIAGYQLNKIEYLNLGKNKNELTDKNEKIANVYGNGHLKFYYHLYRNLIYKLNNQKELDNAYEVVRVTEKINNQLKKFK